MTATRKPGVRIYVPLLLTYVFINSLLFIFGGRLSNWKMDRDVLIVGNLVLLGATALSLFFYLRSLRTGKGTELLKYVYAGVFTKLIVCILAVFPYIIIAGKQVNKPALIICAGLYLVYSAMEVAILLKHNKLQKNAQAGSAA